MKFYLLSCSLLGLLAFSALLADKADAAAFSSSQVTPTPRALSAFPTPVVPVSGKAVTGSTPAVTFRFAVDTQGHLKYMLNGAALGATQAVSPGQEVVRELFLSNLRLAENTFSAEFRTGGDGAALATTTYTVYVDNVAPMPPNDFRAAGADGALLVTWGVPPKPSGFEVIDSFIVSYGPKSFKDMSDEEAARAPNIKVSAINAGSGYEARVKGLENGKTYYVTVRSVDWVDQVSAFAREGEGIRTVSAAPVTTVTMADLAGETGGCFIATAAYGSYEAPFVQILREFRDEILQTNPVGRAFVSWYYQNSPPWAKRLAEHEPLRAIVRILLWPLIAFAWFSLNPALAALVLAASGLAASVWWYRREGVLMESKG